MIPPDPAAAFSKHVTSEVISKRIEGGHETGCRFVHIHVVDWRAWLSRPPARERSFEIERTIKTIQQHRSDIRVVIELWKITAKEREWADKSIQYLRRIVS